MLCCGDDVCGVFLCCVEVFWFCGVLGGGGVDEVNSTVVCCTKVCGAILCCNGVSSAEIHSAVLGGGVVDEEYCTVLGYVVLLCVVLL